MYPLFPSAPLRSVEYFGAADPGLERSGDPERGFVPSDVDHIEEEELGADAALVNHLSFQCLKMKTY